MKIIAFIGCISLLLLCGCATSKTDNTPKKHATLLSALPANIQQIDFSVWDVITKEISMREGEEKETLLKQIPWTEKEQRHFLKLLRAPQSHGDSYAVLVHYNLLFELHTGASKPIRVRISTLTGRLDVFTTDGLIYSSRCEKNLSNYILNLLSKYKAKELIDEDEFTSFE